MTMLGHLLGRRGGAGYWVPSEDEWYKAAYYKGGGTNAGYWAYPLGSDTQTTCAVPGATANTANCDKALGGTFGDFSYVGSYTGSVSPSGAFDQGGSIFERTDGSDYSSQHAVRGGSFGFNASYLAASYRLSKPNTDEINFVGFRVASRVSPLPPGVCGFLDLATQAEVDAVSCIAVEGDVDISGVDITNLDGLAGIASVGGYVNIDTNPALANVDGLAALTSVGGRLDMSTNLALTNLNGLSALTGDSNFMAIDIRSNSVLDEFCGLFPVLDATGVWGSLVWTYKVSGNATNSTQNEILWDIGPCPILRVERVERAGPGG